MIGKFMYRILYVLFRIAFFIWHPVFRVYGRENISEDGALLICPNHSGLADPIWVIFALHPKVMPRMMAKKEVMDVPVLGSVLRWFGAFGVDRGGSDVNAIKTAMKCLKNDQRLILFPEGTRVKPGKVVKVKGGAVLLSHRTGTPILPVYLSPRKSLFCPITCVIGKPRMPEFKTERPREEDYQEQADTIMIDTYRLGENI